MMGFGGCPFAEDELVGNIATESLLEFLHEQQVDSGLNTTELQQAAILAGQLFGKYH